MKPLDHASKSARATRADRVTRAVGLARALSKLGYCSRSQAAGLIRAGRVAVLRRSRSNAWLEIALSEGKNRHIRRMMDACGVEVLRLLRVSVGPLPLGALAKGKVRE